MSEQINIFDENYQHIGVASRQEAHTYGYWHEVFHCWFVSRVDGEDYLYVQLRSPFKKDYPSLFDITAAGHLLENERIADGVREVHEEIGVDVALEDLHSLGVLQYCVERNDLLDREFANVFLYKGDEFLHSFELQVEEVAGMVRTPLADFGQLWQGDRMEITVEGFIVNQHGKREDFTKRVGRDDFVPHDASFYLEVVERIQEALG